jgi:very-short-patch-repair endonuclease
MRYQVDIDRQILRLAEAQHGRISRAQLLALGVGPQVIDRRRRAGRLVRVGRGVYALGHRSATPEARWMTAVLVAGPSAVLSHRSAAALWGLRPYGGAPEVTVPGTAGRKEPVGLKIHRSLQIEATTTAGIPVTTVPRTLLDLAADVPAHHLRRALERAEQLELFDLREVRRLLAAHPRRPGRRALEALLADVHAHDLPLTRSDVEAMLLQLCIDHRLPRPQVNRWDGGKEVDFRWPAQRLVVEVDGWQTHRTRAAFERDRERSQLLALEGFRLVRFSARQLQRAPRLAAARLTALLSSPDLPIDVD